MYPSDLQKSILFVVSRPCSYQCGHTTGPSDCRRDCVSAVSVSILLGGLAWGGRGVIPGAVRNLVFKCTTCMLISIYIQHVHNVVCNVVKDVHAC